MPKDSAKKAHAVKLRWREICPTWGFGGNKLESDMEELSEDPPAVHQERTPALCTRAEGFHPPKS